MKKKNVLIWYLGKFCEAQKYYLYKINEFKKINKKKKNINLFFSFSENSELNYLYKRIKIKNYPIKTFDNYFEAILKTLTIYKLRHDFLNFLKNKKIDVIFCPMFHYWNPFISSKFNSLNIKYVLSIHDFNLHPGENSFFKKKIYEIKKKNADKYVCFSKHIQKKLIKMNNVSIDKVLLSSFYTKNKLHKKNNKIKKLKFLFFGRFLEYKGIGKLIKIFSKKYFVDNNITLTLIGSAGKNFNLPVIKTKNIKIISSWVHENKLDKIIKKYDICVLPYDEASQSGVIPLMFRNSIPVISTPVGGLTNQIKHNINGLVSINKNIFSIEKEIKRVLNLNFFYKLRKGAYDQAAEDNIAFKKNIINLNDFLR